MRTLTTTRSGNGGVYRLTCADPLIAAVELDALRCDLSPGDTNVEDCLHAPDNRSCSIWTRAVFVSTTPGDHLQKHLKVPCAAVP